MAKRKIQRARQGCNWKSLCDKGFPVSGLENSRDPLDRMEAAVDKEARTLRWRKVNLAVSPDDLLDKFGDAIDEINKKE